MSNKEDEPTSKKESSYKRKSQEEGKEKLSVIELGFDEEEATFVKRKDVEVQTSIAIWGEMEEEFTKTANNTRYEYLTMNSIFFGASNMFFFLKRSNCQFSISAIVAMVDAFLKALATCPPPPKHGQPLL